jgi:transitional endoplasmic reticulum ATPase
MAETAGSQTSGSQTSGSQTPEPDTFECVGCEVELVDAPGILAVAAVRRVELLHGVSFPKPLRRVSLAVSPSTTPTGTTRTGATEPASLRMVAEIRTEVSGPTWDRLRMLVLGRDPLGALLAWRVAAGDPWATRLVDGVTTVAAKAYRRMGWRWVEPDPSRGAGEHDVAVLEDAEVGLRASVTYDESADLSGRTIRVQASVPVADAGPAHLRAMFCLVLQLVSEISPVAGQRYVLRAGPAPAADRPSGASDAVTLDQVGGLAWVVAQMREIAVSFRHPEAMARWGAQRPQGILLYGPPGTGKTMLARALANEIGATFREIRTPEILDKWLGGSERNIKRIFRDARRYRGPTLMLFDEFDSIISYTSSGGDAASQAINAVAGIFKQEMNNLIEENPNVIVVATTNFPERVDDSLIRSGRFDIKLAIPLPDAAGREEIIGKRIDLLVAGQTAPGFRMFADNLDLAELAQASAGMSGADIREVFRRVQLAKAMQEARTEVPGAPIAQADLLDSIRTLRS